MERAADAQEKIAAIEEALAAEAAPGQLLDLASRALLALEFRATDAIIGLEPTAEERLIRLREVAEAALLKAVQAGHKPAYPVYADQVVSHGEPEVGFTTLLPLAEDGDGDAAIWAAHLAYFTRHQERAMEAFVLAGRGARATSLPEAKAGHGDYLRGLFFTTSFGCHEDDGTALKHHLAAEAQGQIDALFELYVFYAKGMGCDEDLCRAMGYLTRAAEQGHSRSMYSLATHYATGKGVESDPARALDWYGGAAEAGHGRAAATAGVMLALGEEVEGDDARARASFDQAEALGFPWRDLAGACGVDVDELS